MRKASLMTWVSIFAVFLAGCQTGGNEQASQNAINPSPIAIKPRPKPSPQATPFDKPPVVAQKPGNNSAVAGLIQPELPENAVKRVPLGQRSDPFSAVPAQPVVTVSPNPSAQGATTPRPVPRIPQLPSVPSRGGTPGNRPPAPKPTTTTKFRLPRLPQTARRPNVLPQRQQVRQPPKAVASKPTRPASSRATGAKPTQPNSLPTQPNNLPGSPANSPLATAPRPIPELPKLPEPTQARGVEVTGVAQVGGVPMAIVKVPNEPARYVREGQRIANGQVLVKRIEMNRGPEPVVILEQYGIEVARGVGEPPAASPGGPGQPPPPPTASLPSVSPPLSTNAAPQA